MIHIRVRSRIEVEGQNFGEALVISIVSPGTAHPKITARHVYQFSFNDIQEDLMVDSGIMSAMSENIAEYIVNVAMEHRDIETWVIHCEAGISRSPGIAIGLAKHLRCTPNARELERMYPHYNRHVEQHIAAAARKRICEIAQHLRVQFNFE